MTLEFFCLAFKASLHGFFELAVFKDAFAITGAAQYSTKSREEMMARILFLAWFLQPKQTDSGSH